MTKYTVTLTKEEREKLETLISRGKHSAQTVVNALVLLACDKSNIRKNAQAIKLLPRH